MNIHPLHLLRNTALRHRVVLRHIFLAAGILATLPFVLDGIRAEKWSDQRMLLLYIAPLWLEAFLWFRARAGDPSTWCAGALVVDVAALLMSASRMIPLPFFPWSGHMLFLVYTVLTTRERFYRWTAIILILETSVFKLWLWNDWTSWSIGIVIGLAGALVHRRAVADRLRR